MSAPERWWRDPTTLRRFIGDLVVSELRALRPGAGPVPLGSEVGPEYELGAGGLGADSLELLTLASALNETLHMHRCGIEDHLLARRTLDGWVELANVALEEFSREMTFRSSGTTGRPRACSHRLVDLIQEINELARRLPGRRRVLAAVPSHHIYGFLFTILLPARWNVEVLDIRRQSPASVAASLTEGDLLAGHPGFWEALLRGGARIPPGVLGVTSTAPCPPEVARRVIDHGLDGLLEVYGSSETAGIARRDRPGAEFELLDFWAAADDGNRLTRTHVDGGRSEHVLPDRLIWSGPRRFSVAGRLDGAVQVGGINVDPAAVAAALSDHPQVAAAAVRLMQPEEGARLKSFIVPADHAIDHAELTAELTAWADRHLTVPERPRAFTFGPALPVGELGKPADWPLPSSP